MHSISEAMSGMAHGHRTPRKEPQAAPAGADGAGHTELHDHGDGTFHTVTPDGEKTEHPHLGHALAHIAHHHMPDGAHSHVHHQEEGGHVSHHVKEDGAVSGPHEHEDLEGVKEQMGKFLGEDGHESAGHESAGYEGGHEGGKSESHGSRHAMFD